MITNNLTEDEFKGIMLPIIKLENIQTVKEVIYRILNFTKAPPTDKKQYRICHETTGINSLYKGFEIDVRKLNDIENDYNGVIIRFRKRKILIDHFLNPQKKIVNSLANLCEKEINQARFKKFKPGGIIKDNVKEVFFYQIGTLNDKWKRENKLSPLTIFTRDDSNFLLVEFLFTPMCYERKSNKTNLKDNWNEIFRLNTPSW